MIEKENLIEIPCGDEDLVIEIIDSFNKSYKTRFCVLSVDVRDGVIFVVVDRAGASLSDVCTLGFFHGAKIQELRMKGQIDY